MKKFLLTGPVAILIGEQFHQSDDAENIARSFKHYLSLASTARSEKQRQDALASLKAQISNGVFKPPIGTLTILTKILPLISDCSVLVRRQLLDLLRCLPPHEVAAEVERVIIFVRAGMTHLSADIAGDTLAVVNWLLDIAPEELVSCPGGWIKTLNNFCAMLGWSTANNGGWSMAPLKSSSRAKDATMRAGQLATLTRFLDAGLRSEVEPRQVSICHSHGWPSSFFRHHMDLLHFEHLNIFGARRDEDCEMYTNREARQLVFSKKFLKNMEAAIELEKKEGGVLGRAAAALQQALQQGLMDFEDPHISNMDDLMCLW